VKSKAATCEAFHDLWSIFNTGCTNSAREHDRIIANTHTATRRPEAGSHHIPRRP
jgi:hypothetical protein